MGATHQNRKLSASTLSPFLNVDEEESSDTPTKKKGKDKRVYKPRGISYSTFEDVLLCRAWLLLA